MPQADANAFKVLKRNHALLRRKSRDAFDIHKKNKRLKPGKKIKIPKLNANQKELIQHKIKAYHRASLFRKTVQLTLSLLLSAALFYWVVSFFELTF